VGRGGCLVIVREQVRRVEGSTFLGVWVDTELKWSGHINQVGGKMWQFLSPLLHRALHLWGPPFWWGPCAAAPLAHA
jgi:hypothetical protein